MTSPLSKRVKTRHSLSLLYVSQMPSMRIGPLQGVLLYLSDAEIAMWMRTCAHMYHREYPHMTLPHRMYPATQLLNSIPFLKQIRIVDEYVPLSLLNLQQVDLCAKWRRVKTLWVERQPQSKATLSTETVTFLSQLCSVPTQLSTLTFKNVLGSPMNDKFGMIANQESLTILDIGSCGLTEEETRTLGTYLTATSSLHTLTIGHTSVPYWEHLTSALSANRTLTLLILNSVIRNDADGAELVRQLTFHPTLRTLNLHFNIALRQETAIALGGLLKQNPRITDLNVMGASFGQGAIPFFDGLRANTTLRILDLSYVPLLSSVVIDLAQAIAIHPTLTTLNVEHSWDYALMDVSIFYQSVAINKSLTQLSLANTGIRDHHVNDMCRLLSQNQTLRFLDLDGNNIQLTGIQFLLHHLLPPTTKLKQINCSRTHWVSNDDEMAIAAAVDAQTTGTCQVAYGGVLYLLGQRQIR